MYTLRIVSENSVLNKSLGNIYVNVNRTLNYENFKHYFKSHFGKDHVDDLDESSDDNTKNVIGFIVTGETTPIYQDRNYYIMTDTGKTFECINKASNL